MEEYQIAFSKVNIFKSSICFSWDDNFHRHKDIVSEIFDDFNIRCTFYINVGDDNFSKKLENDYRMLSYMGFEIGSHGYNHISMEHLSNEKFIYQITSSIDFMKNVMTIRPTTFAFPHHQHTIWQINALNSFFITTRNTLYNSQRISLKSHSTLDEISYYIRELLFNHVNVVFSGHSVWTPMDAQSDYIDGYEPVNIDMLHKLCQHISIYSSISEIITVEQAAIKEYIKNRCKYTKSFCVFSNEDILYLTSLGLDLNKLNNIL